MSNTTGPNPGTTPTTYHIYPQKKHHKSIQKAIDFSNESRFGTAKRKLKDKKNKQPQNTVVDKQDGVDASFFLHKPYFAFHRPPKVLYAGADKRAKPVVLIHASEFWREYKLQYGDSLAAGVVLDPRGVVTWKHNGGNSEDLKLDDRKFKGYKVRTRRLWGESGKQYVHQIKTNRHSDTGHDPDVLVTTGGEKGQWPAKADGVVYLKWERPFSWKTRQYNFKYASMDFRWKGTRSVHKSGFWGMFLRYSHLKLEVQLPNTMPGKGSGTTICLGKYLSSVSKKKCGRLELDGDAILKLQAQITRSATEDVSVQNIVEEQKFVEDNRLYHIIVATAMCMIESEKEKRILAGKWLRDAAEEAGDGGG